MSSPRDLDRKPADPGAGGASPGAANDPLRFARALIGDLVDKNLWPVALLLCVAIVAIPVLMTRSAGSGVPAAAPAPDVSPTKGVKLIAPPAVKERTGAQLDPFRQPKKKKKASAAAGSIALGGSPPAASPSAGAPSAATPSGGTPSGAMPSAGSPSTGSPSTGTPSAKATPEISAAKVYYRTEVRWSEAEGGATRPISRLTPLGDPGERAALYLGVSDAGFAVFLLSPHARAEGVAGCEDAGSCRLMGLKAGRTQIISVQSPDGSKAHRFHLEAVSIKRVVTSVATASRMRAKVHSEGRAVMRALWADRATALELGGIRYDQPTGLLVKSSAVKKTTK
jgi:hypothetical protein